MALSQPVVTFSNVINVIEKLTVFCLEVESNLDDLIVLALISESDVDR